MALGPTAKRILKTTSLLVFSQHAGKTCVHILNLLTYALQKVNDGFKRVSGEVISMDFFRGWSIL